MSAQGYTPEEQAAAYYAQQGYTPDQITAALGGGGGGQSSYSASSAGYDYNSSSAGAGGSSSTGLYPNTTLAAALPGAYQPVYDADFLQQSSIYTPEGAAELAKSAAAQQSKQPKAGTGAPGKRETVIRKGNGRTWEDPTLLEWDPKWFRLFVGDVSNDVNERTIDEAFNKYPSYCKCKVVRDRLSLKAKYGFIAFKDPEDFLKAWKEMDGKYVGNRPIRLSKVQDDKYGSIATVKVSGRKARELDKLRKNQGRPLDGRPVPW
ncbi:hypothetical protein CI109_103705 [Kwoniella shandongensis]|uniref:RRM domain-containing protein n=1 Tax=Kwoniella shandongensis TaxID=1734106 RepID=A0AAJ8LJW9_9TREE